MRHHHYNRFHRATSPVVVFAQFYGNRGSRTPPCSLIHLSQSHPLSLSSAPIELTASTTMFIKCFTVVGIFHGPRLGHRHRNKIILSRLCIVESSSEPPFRSTIDFRIFSHFTFSTAKCTHALTANAKIIIIIIKIDHHN